MQLDVDWKEVNKAKLLLVELSRQSCPERDKEKLKTAINFIEKAEGIFCT